MEECVKNLAVDLCFLAACALATAAVALNASVFIELVRTL
jgi:hypothetical protein